MYLTCHIIVGISDNSTTVQVAVQTPPSRRKGVSNVHSQNKMAKRMKKYDLGNEHTDEKLRLQNNQVMPQGKLSCNFSRNPVFDNTFYVNDS